MHISIFDNSSIDKSDSSKSTNITYIKSDNNVGAGAGHNVCIERALAYCPSHHLVSNTDIDLEIRSLQTLLNHAKEQPEVGIAVSAIYYPDSSQRAYRTHPTFKIIAVRFFNKILLKSFVDKVNAEHELYDVDFAEIQDIPAVNGCFLLVNSEVFNTVGCFDERYFLYFEDLDFFRRVGAKYDVFEDGLFFLPDFVRFLYQYPSYSRGIYY